MTINKLRRLGPLNESEVDRTQMEDAIIKQAGDAEYCAKNQTWCGKLNDLTKASSTDPAAPVNVADSVKKLSNDDIIELYKSMIETGVAIEEAAGSWIITNGQEEYALIEDGKYSMVHNKEAATSYGSKKDAEDAISSNKLELNLGAELKAISINEGTPHGNVTSDMPDSILEDDKQDVIDAFNRHFKDNNDMEKSIEAASKDTGYSHELVRNMLGESKVLESINTNEALNKVLLPDARMFVENFKLTASGKKIHEAGSANSVYVVEAFGKRGATSDLLPTHMATQDDPDKFLGGLFRKGDVCNIAPDGNITLLTGSAAGSEFKYKDEEKESNMEYWKPIS